MDIELVRFAYTPEDTQGRLIIGAWSCFTIEQPWKQWQHRGGKPYESCIPDGTYDCLPYLRPSGEKAFVLVNPDLGVHFHEADRPGGHGRFLCLIHAANYAAELRGCIAPGRHRVIRSERLSLMVTSSRDTMREIIQRIGWADEHRLTIRRTAGAVDVPLASAA